MFFFKVMKLHKKRLLGEKKKETTLPSALEIQSLLNENANGERHWHGGERGALNPAA